MGHKQRSSLQLLERNHAFFLLLLLPACWDPYEMTGPLGAVLDQEVTLGMDAACDRAKREKKPGPLTQSAPLHLWAACL